MKQNLRLSILCCLILVLTNCSKKSNQTDALPVANINSITEERTTSQSVYKFTVTLNKAATSEVTINYTTTPGTALATVDYVATSGVLKFAPNQLEGYINVTVTGDSVRKEAQEFYVQLDNATNCTLQTSKGTGTITNKDGLYYPVPNTGYTTPLNYPGYSLVWNDEFDNKTINSNSWTFESGNNNGWGNNELEYYTDRSQNVFVSNGNLIIEARKEQYNGYNYTSTRMITKNKKVFKYARVDMRAKMPKGKGIWPALWMLGNNIDQVNWPACGEIDVLEYLGHETNKIYGTLHWGANTAAHASKGTNYTLSSGGFDQEFHVYSLLWKQDEIKVLVDDKLYLTVVASDIAGSNPFNSNFFFIFNLAVGGNWPGSPDATTTFPQRLVVDYIRVFQ